MTLKYIQYYHVIASAKHTRIEHNEKKHEASHSRICGPRSLTGERIRHPQARPQAPLPPPLPVRCHLHLRPKSPLCRPQRVSTSYLSNV